MLERNRSRSPATLSEPRGCISVALVVLVFFWMSNPLVLVPTFWMSLDNAIVWTLALTLATVPWLRVPLVPWPWFVFLSLCALSITWSIAPDDTQSSLVLYLKITAVALIIGANVDLRVLSWGLGLGGVLVLATSLYAFDQAMPGASYTTSDGSTALAGVGTNENILAYTLTIALAASLATPMPRARTLRALWTAVVLVNCYGIYLAGSGTGYVSSALVVVVAFFLSIAPRLNSRRRRDLWTALAAALAFMVVVVVAVINVLGMELSTFSGRVPFWEATIKTSSDHMLVGSGWGAVWNHPWDPSPPNDVLDSIYANAGYPLTHGHNLFIDVLPELGMVGVLSSAVMVGCLCRLAYRLGRFGESGREVSRMVALVLVAVLAFGMTEPMFTVPLGWWSLTVAAALGALASRWETTQQRVAGQPTSPGNRSDR